MFSTHSFKSLPDPSLKGEEEQSYRMTKSEMVLDDEKMLASATVSRILSHYL